LSKLFAVCALALAWLAGCNAPAACVEERWTGANVTSCPLEKPTTVELTLEKASR
jgi:hypothetical protein